MGQGQGLDGTDPPAAALDIRWEKEAYGREESALPKVVDADVGALGFIEHPPPVLPVVRVLSTKIIPDDLPRAVLGG